MPADYDRWKLATPPEYSDDWITPLESDPREGDDEPTEEDIAEELESALRAWCVWLGQDRPFDAETVELRLLEAAGAAGIFSGVPEE